jgi:anti-anti-sigma factor
VLNFLCLSAAWEEANADGNIEGVRIDCAQLEYISSAGIRLLLEMQENCSRHIVFSGASVKVKKILQQKGFGEVI